MPDITETIYVLAVPNVTETARYFTEELGFDLLPMEDEGWRFVQRGTCRVMMGECPDALRPSELGDHSYFGYFVVDDVDAIAAEYKAKNVHFRTEVEDKPWRMREFAIETPDGHRIMFGQDLD